MARKLNILIVENCEDDATLLEREIRKGIYEIESLVISDLDELPHALKSRSWDLVLSDYNLDGFNALDVIEVVRQNLFTLPIIVISVCIGEDLAVEVMRNGAHDYISKENLARLNLTIAREIEQLDMQREGLRAELALKESESRFRQMAENIEEVFWLLDVRKQQVLYSSPSFEQLWERPAEEVLLSTEVFLETVHPDDYELVQSSLTKSGSMLLNMDYRILRPDNSLCWLSTRSYPILDEVGNVCRIAGLTVDITDMKSLESEMKLLARVVEQTADSVIIADKEGKIKYVNDAFEYISGYERKDIINEHTRILKSGMHDDVFYKKVSVTLKNGLPYKDLFINRRKDGELYYEEKTISPVRDESKAISHYVSTGKDITQRLKRQQRLHNVIHYDAVTGLANNILLNDRIEQAMLNARRKKLMVAVVKINIDVSELFGEGFAKELEEKFLVQVAERLKESVRANDTVASLNQSDFVIVLNEVINEEAILMVTDRIMLSLSCPMELEGHTLFIRPNLGISAYPKDADDKDELLAHADIAMQHAKQKKTSDSYRFFTTTMVQKESDVWLSS